MYSKITHGIIVAFIASLQLCITPSASSQIRYNVIDLGGLPGYENSRPWSINNNGQVVGEAWNIDTFNWRAVLFDTSGAGNNIDLGTLGGQDSWARSINDFGQIAGGAADLQSYSATIFDSTGSGNNTALTANSSAWSINNSGQIAGFVNLNPDGTICHAALFDQGQQGNYTDLGCLPNYNVSEALSINNTGMIVGGTYNFNPSDPYYFWRSRAVLFNSADPSYNIDLGTLTGYEYAMALSINDNGRIVGRTNNSDMTTANYNPRAVLFDPNDPSNNLDLGTLPGYDAAEAYAINNRDQIVGRANHSNNWQYDAAVLLDPSGRGNTINLNTLIDPVIGWNLRLAWSINDRGWIVGMGECPGGYNHAFLLIPAADFDRNGKVDFYDFAIFAAAWDTTFDDDNYNPSCDLETDGQIYYDDLAIFADSWSPGL